MKGSRRFWGLLFAALLCLAACPALANSAEPPQLVVLVNNAPTDLSVEAEVNGSRLPVSKRAQGWETYYVFYYMGQAGPSTLDVSSDGQTYSIPLGAFAQKYNNVFTLDVAARTLRQGTLPLRNALLIAMRVVFTLLIEGAVFLLFGFRKKESWLAFLIINLLTQGLLNLALSSGGVLDSYRMLMLIFLEILVLIVEIPAFLFAVKEHANGRRALYAIAANIASFVAGGYMITLLPV